MAEASFQFLDRIHMTVRGPAWLLHHPLNHILEQYQNFRSEPVRNPEIEVVIGPLDSPPREIVMFDDTVGIAQDQIYCKRDGGRIGSWSADIQGIDTGRIRARLDPSLFGALYLSGVFTNFFVHAQLARAQSPLTHSSAVEVNGRAFLFSGRGGAGKTTAALNLAKNGAPLLGDNFVALSSGRCESFLSPLSLFRYNVTPHLRSRLPETKRFELAVKQLLFTASGGSMKWFTKLNPRDVLPCSQGKCDIEAVFLLRPWESFYVRPVERQRALAIMRTNQQMDFLPFDRYRQLYAAVFPTSDLGRHWENYEEAVNKALPRKVNFFEVGVPPGTDLARQDDILRMLKA